MCSYQVSSSLIGKIIPHGDSYMTDHLHSICGCMLGWAHTHRETNTYAFKENTSIMFLQCITEKGHLPEKYVSLLIQTTKQPHYF